MNNEQKENPEMTSVADLRAYDINDGTPTLREVLEAGYLALTPGADLEMTGRMIDKLDLAQARMDGYLYRRMQFAEYALSEFVTHLDSWRDAIEIAVEHADVNAPDVDDKSYWRHEMAALESAMAGAITVLAEKRKDEANGSLNFEDYVRDRRQKQVMAWALRSFVNETIPDATRAVVMSPEQRALRFLEEAVELYQAIAWMVACQEYPAERKNPRTLRYDGLLRKGHNCLRTMFEKQPGIPAQEVGGTMVTLLCLAESLGISVAAEEKSEFARVLSFPRSHWQQRWAAKREIGL